MLLLASPFARPGETAPCQNPATLTNHSRNPPQIKSANEILALARQHERKKFIASSSVMLTVEMVKISNAINAYTGAPNRETRTLEEIFESCRLLEDQCRTAARRRMMVYGLLYKRGHIVKNWQMRMFVLDGGKLSYYQLGETEPRGNLMLHLIRKVSHVSLPMKRHCFKVETTSKEYIMQAPDEASLQIWMDALKPYKEGFLTKQGAGGTVGRKNWKRRWFVLYKTQLAYFDGPSGSARRERNGYILLKEVLPGSVHPVDETMFGKPNIFQVETKNRTFYIQADTVDIMDDWLDSILRSIQTRGRLQSVSAALEAGEMDGPAGDSDVSRDSSAMAPEGKSQAQLERIAAETREVDEEEGVMGAGGDQYQIAAPEITGGGMAMSEQDVANTAGLQSQLGKAYTSGGPGLSGAAGVGDMLSAHATDLQAMEKELELKAQEHKVEMQAKEADLAVQEQQLQMELQQLEMDGGGGAAAAPAQRKFTLLVSSEDTELLPEQRKCVAEAATVEELFATVQEKLALPVEIMVLMYDEDFEEWILLPKLEDLPDKAKVQIKRKDE